MRTLLPAMVLLAGCSPYIGPKTHQVNMGEVGEGTGSVEITDLGEVELIPAPPGTTPTDVWSASSTAVFAAVTASESYVGHISGDSVSGVYVPGRIKYFADDDFGPWAFDNELDRVAPLYELENNPDMWIQLDGATRIGAGPYGGVWVTDRAAGRIHEVDYEYVPRTVLISEGAAWDSLERVGDRAWVVDLQDPAELVQIDNFATERARSATDCRDVEMIRGESPDGAGWAGGCRRWWWAESEGDSGVAQPNVGTLSKTGAWFDDELWFTTTDEDGRPVLGYSDNPAGAADVYLHDVTLGDAGSTAWVADVSEDGTVWAVMQDSDGGGGIVRLSRRLR